MKPFNPYLVLSLSAAITIFVTGCEADDDDDHDHHHGRSSTTTTTVEERHIAPAGAVQETRVERY